MTDAAVLTVHPSSRVDASAAARAGRTRRMLEGPIGPTLARLAAPNVLAMVVTAAISIAEAAFAGRMGVAALAGLALVFPLVILTQLLAAGAMGGAISSAVARALGGGDVERAGRLAGAACVIAVAAAGLSTVLVMVGARPLFAALGGGEAAIDAAVDYAVVYFIGCIAVWLCHTALSVVRGAGDMMAPSLVLLFVAVASTPLSGALAFGWGPIPALGMSGLAAGQVAAHGLGAAAALGCLLGGRAGLTLSFLGLRWALFRDILRVGLIASVNGVLTVLTVVIMVALVGRHGPEALAGYGLGARLEFLMIPVVFGIGAALTAMVGANIGAGNRPRALRIGWTGACAAAAIVGAFGLLFAAAPDLWLRLFVDAGETGALSAGRAYFRIVGPAYAFFAFGLALYFASQGAGRIVWPVAASVVRMAVAIGGGIALGEVLGLGLHGFFLGVAAGMAIYGIVTALAIRATGWR